MKSRQTMFFALIDDIDGIIREIESMLEVQYYKTGLFDIKAIPTYQSLFSTPNIGRAISGDWNKIDGYLIVKRTMPIKIREIQQRSGELKFAVDQMTNPKSIEIKLGGVYKDNVIVAGRIATISEDIESIELYRLFTSKIKKGSKKIGSFYVGKKAEEKLKMGWRLVTNEKLPKEYDLAIS